MLIHRHYFKSILYNKLTKSITNIKNHSSFKYKILFRSFSLLHSSKPTISVVLSTYIPIRRISIRFMKRLTFNTLTTTQKERLALHTQEFIKNNFQKSFQTKQDLLQNNINFMTDESLTENILNQTLTKAAFPRFSDTKINISSKLHVSKKVEIPEAQEKSDFRFIPEILTTSRFAESSNMIKKITMNSEKPNSNSNIAETTISVGNKYKDITLFLETPNKYQAFPLDIKSGNNANNPFSGILAQIPYVNTEKVYNITNQELSLTEIQEKRMTYLGKNSVSPKFDQIYRCIEDLNKLVLDPIQKNILIQEEMFKLMSQNLLSQRPSFYYAFIMDNQTTLNQIFYAKLAPHINPHIFDNAKNAQKFMKQAFIAYTQSVEDISSNINKSKNGWMGTGFENIADDLFK